MENKFISGIWKNQYGYKSFLPNLINKPFIWHDPKINILLEKANLELGKLESFSNFIPDIEFFISMHIGKEAIKSSRIEGTKTEFDDLFLEDTSSKTVEEKNDIQEVKNYIDALNLGIQYLEKLPLTFRLFSEIHKTLLKGVRGEQKSPGEIRKSQNWIGGSSLKDAFFIPPHQDDLSDLITDFEKFLHNDDIQIPELIKIAIAHYQFETIHPYLDGNGRIGRLLIILYLIEKNILTRPVLYISDFFERNKGSYYDALTVVRSSNDIEHFIKFFLNGVIETCKSSTYTFQEILKLKKYYGDKILLLGNKAEKGNILFNKLFSQPYVSAINVSHIIGVSLTTSNDYIKKFIEIGILKEITGLKKNKVYSFDEYLKLFR
ncbi:MAG: Fic family protein [Candidatus Gracilibacteria bacterium]